MAARVILYMTRWCGFCVRTKRYLDAREIPYEAVDVDEHPEFDEQIRRASGGSRTVPTLEIGGKLLVNPSPAVIEAALAAAD